MTQKKPASLSWESFVEEQIRAAQEAGEFDHLPGFGKPIPELDEPDDELWWIKNLLKRERLSLLPPGLEILRTVEREMERILRLRSEEEVRHAVQQLNDQIRRANFAITWGPASTASLLDADEVVARWRTHTS
jgi:hypothetical protein